MDIAITTAGHAELRERAGKRGFHHSWMPTAAYRERFGCLNYHTTEGSSFFLPDGVIVNPRPPVPMLVVQAGLVGLPEAVVKAGQALCTGVIHHRTLTSPRYWTGRWSPEWQDVEWPEEYGGEALKQRIAQFIASLPPRRRAPLPNPDAVIPDDSQESASPKDLSKILAPERDRQLDTMRHAIHAMCSLVWG